jgi:hypothetical protein
MAATATGRVWASLAAKEASEVARAAAERGMRPSELARQALLAYVRETPPPSGGEGTAAVSRLEGLAETLGRHADALARVVANAEAVRREQEEVRAALRDLAAGIGILASAIMQPDDGDDAFGGG